MFSINITSFHLKYNITFTNNKEMVVHTIFHVCFVKDIQQNIQALGYTNDYKNV